MIEPIAYLVNNIRINYTENTTQKKPRIMEAELKSRIPQFQQCKVKDKPNFVTFLLYTGNKEIDV